MLDIGISVIDDAFVNRVRFWQYVNFALNTLAFMASVFMILKRSTKEMQIYRWFLLNISVGTSSLSRKPVLHIKNL